VTWDNKWHGEASIHDTYWEAEMAIPFSTLRFQEGGTEWRFNAYRNDTQFNELSSWANIPRNRLIMDLAYMGKVVWEEPPGNAGSSVSLIPYTIGGVSRDYEDPASSKPKTTGNIGLDAKIGITSGLNLDLTVNPDFSQVEVDRQVTNLDRFEIFFPEKRQFFLENADLFSSFGLRHVNPFFSRRIGVARDTATGQNIQNPIHYGARLSGKINENLRVGLLNTQTAREVENGLPSFNYTVAALQQKVFNRSNISFIFANKQAFRPQESLGDFNTFNRVAGLEYRLASADNRWSGKAFYHHAFQPVQQEHPFTQGLQLEYQKRRYRAEWAHLLVGNGYNAEIGFVPRKDYMLLSPELQVFFFPRGGVVNTHSITADTRFFLQIGRDGNQIIAPWGLSERQTQVSWELQFIDNGRANITLTENDLTLLNDFDPTRLQDAGVFLAAGDKYHYVDISASYTSDFRRKISFTARPGGGQFYNGYRYGLAGAVTWRLQPLGSVALSWDYNHVNLADPFVPADILLVGPRFDFTFSKELFFTTFIQYNNQLDNLNVNARLQWRFAPVSDFFIVYTNNFLMDPFSQFSQFGERNQALVAKLTYWLNL
ncbi:MAG: DUF5916 domain-containing protein, partial [Cyclobacteriaceae bacterium]|nr:DUF5916 domain-containing protein [Cyclobacteriaceae bacterium]